MNKTNQELAHSLLQFSDLMEAFGENPYKVRAYRRVAHTLLLLKEEVVAMYNEGKKLTSIPGVGKGIESALIHLIETNEELVLKERKLNAQNEKFKSISFIRLHHALLINELMLNHLKALPEVQWVESCGDFRRKKEIIEELVFLLCADNFSKVIEKIIQFREVTSVLNQTASSITLGLHTGIKMICFLTFQQSKGTSLIYKTGSVKHVKELEKFARSRAFDLKEQGLYKKDSYVAGNSEHEIYTHLGLEFIEPELREGVGEIDAAYHHTLPELVDLNDIKGDLHSHTNETDGKETLENMVKAAMNQGYEYFAITDHSKHLTITHGLNESRLLKQIEKINKLNETLKSFQILKSIEVDILEDGSLDLSDAVLKELDLRVCSIHSKFKLPESKQTERIIRAMDNPYFNILGHATGRLIRSRPAYAVNMERIMISAKERGCFLELNSQPYRLDINDHYCRMAKEIGVKIAISSDAHSIQGLNFIKLGIYQARRGWLKKEDILNTYSWSCLKKLLDRN